VERHGYSKPDTPMSIHHMMNRIRKELSMAKWIGSTESDNASYLIHYNNNSIDNFALLQSYRSVFVIKDFEVVTILTAPYNDQILDMQSFPVYIAEIEKILYVNQVLADSSRIRQNQNMDVLEPITPSPILYYEKELVLSLSMAANQLLPTCIEPKLTMFSKHAYVSDYALELSENYGRPAYEIATMLADIIQSEYLEVSVYKNGKIKFKLKKKKDQNENNN
jgi:hypothetical protein